jgi:hypothetical protein
MITDIFGRESIDSPTSFYWELQHGRIPGTSFVDVRGFNPDIDTGQYEDLIPWGGLYTYQSVAGVRTIYSSDAADSPAGIGLWTAEVSGLGAGFNPISEIVTMNGLTGVTLANQYLRVNRILGLTAGGHRANVGTIQVRVGVSSTVQQQIEPNEGISKGGVFTVPAGYKAYVESAVFNVRRGAADFCDVSVGVRNVGISDGCVLLTGDVTLQGGGTNSIQLDGFMRAVPEKHDIFMRAFGASANNVAMSGRIQLVLEQQ